jgi:GTP-binding protein
VVLVAKPALTTLAGFRRRRLYRAEGGRHGEGGKRHGRSGEDLVISVPVGTIVRRVGGDGPGEVVADLVAPGQQIVVARAGKGGRGNARFTTSTRQAPRIAEHGQRGELARLLLDLKLLSDVGIVGLPNAGKSTLLRRVSAARPKVADYPFTTLEPVLGVVEVGYESFVLADLPGIIEGAHEGAGLGHQFLRHVERTRVLLHLIDGSRPDPVADLRTLNQELAWYSEELGQKRQQVVVNKVDLPEVRGRRGELEVGLEALGHDPLFISAATGEGVQELVRRLLELLAAVEVPASLPSEVPVLRPRGRQPRFTVTKGDGVFVVEGEGPVSLVEMMGLDSEEARLEVRRRLTRMGVVAALRRAGISPGDHVRFGTVEMEWQE